MKRAEQIGKFVLDEEAINPDPKLAMLEIMEKNISGSEFIGEKNPP